MIHNNDFYCINCHHKLPEYFTIAALDQIDENNYKYIENKVHVEILRNQNVNVICPNCGEETFPAMKAELYRKKEEEKEETIEEPNVFKKFEIF